MLLNDFRTEYCNEPLAVENRAPRFGWKYPSDFTGKQISYRICVATREELLASPDMWDSGEVASGESVAVSYAGKPLETHSRYYVRCVTRDQSGGEYDSGVHTFETALYNDSDWLGKWVSVQCNFSGGTLLFRRDIEVPAGKKILRARAYVCGLGYHEFFLNGAKVGNSALNPGVTEYSRRVLYCAYPLDGLHEGRNVMGVEVGYGWLGDRKLLVQVYIEYADGTADEIHSGPGNGWWVGGSPTVYNSIYGGETYDARIEDIYPRNWCTADYEPTWANGWMYTIYTAPPAGKLEAQEIEPIEVCGEFPEVSRTDMGGGVYVLDMGQNFAGWAEISVKGERGAAVTLKFGEQLCADGYVNRINLRSAKCTDTYILRGEGTEKWAPRFTYHGFRYIQAEISGKAELLTAVGKHVHTATRVIGSFECSDALINKLHRNAVITEQNNQHSVPTDCPQRDERFGWLNDLSARVYQTVYNVDISRFIPKFVRDITHTQAPDGGIGDTAPYFTGGVPADPVSVIYALMPDYAYRYYGDSHTCAEEYASVKKWVDLLLSKSQNYIMDYSYYGDWVPPYPQLKSDGIYVSTLYLLWHLLEMSRLAKIVGKKSDEKKYADHAEKAKKAINAEYFNQETCSYCGGTQTENALALSLRIVPEEFAQAVADNIHRDVVGRNYHCTSGNIGYRHVFYVLADYGYIDDVLAILRNPEYPGWGHMIANGATTVWERWEAEMQNEMHSFDHPMFGSYDAFFYRYLAGISVAEDAYACDKVSIAPVFVGSLDRVSASVQTPRGKVVSEWKRVGDTVKLHVEIPPMTTAEITCGGKTYTVGAGKYDYEV